MKETDAFRKNRVLTQLESLAVRLEVVVGYWERRVAKELEREYQEADDAGLSKIATEEPPVDKAKEEAERARLDEEMEQRFFSAQQLADRVVNGEITEEEKEEYMTRWLR